MSSYKSINDVLESKENDKTKSNFFALTESKNPGNNMPTYHIDFGEQEPTQELTDSAIDELMVFKMMEWDFYIEVNMVKSPVKSHLKFLSSYRKMFKSLPQRHCQKITIVLPFFSVPLVGSLVAGMLKTLLNIIMKEVEIVFDDAVTSEDHISESK